MRSILLRAVDFAQSPVMPWVLSKKLVTNEADVYKILAELQPDLAWRITSSSVRHPFDADFICPSGTTLSAFLQNCRKYCKLSHRVVAPDYLDMPNAFLVESAKILGLGLFDGISLDLWCSVVEPQPKEAITLLKTLRAQGWNNIDVNCVGCGWVHVPGITDLVDSCTLSVGPDSWKINEADIISARADGVKTVFGLTDYPGEIQRLLGFAPDQIASILRGIYASMGQGTIWSYILSVVIEPLSVEYDTRTLVLSDKTQTVYDVIQELLGPPKTSTNLSISASVS